MPSLAILVSAVLVLSFGRTDRQPQTRMIAIQTRLPSASETVNTTAIVRGEHL